MYRVWHVPPGGSKWVTVASRNITSCIELWYWVVPGVVSGAVTQRMPDIMQHLVSSCATGWFHVVWVTVGSKHCVTLRNKGLWCRHYKGSHCGLFTWWGGAAWWGVLFEQVPLGGSKRIPGAAEDGTEASLKLVIVV